MASSSKSTDNNANGETEEHHPVLTELLDKYNKLVDGISPTTFDFVTDILKEDNLNIELDTAMLVDELKFNLSGTIRRDLLDSWKENNMDELLSSLDKLKSKARFSTAKQWRPTGKTPDEQVRPIKINALHKKIEYFKKSIDLQKQQIETLIPKVESKRAAHEKFLKKRSEIVKYMDSETDKFDQIEAELNEKMKFATQTNF